MPHLHVEFLDGTPDAAFETGFLLTAQVVGNGVPPQCLDDNTCNLGLKMNAQTLNKKPNSSAE